MIERDLHLDGDRTIHVYDTGTGTGTGTEDRLPVIWHHGTPNVGAPPEPLFAAAERLGLRSPEPHALPLVLSHGWPGSVGRGPR